MSAPRMSHAEMHRMGWTRTDARVPIGDEMWSKLRARWTHRAGYRLEHCGHPTAIRPWALYAPDGTLIGTMMNLAHAATWVYNDMKGN